MPGGKVHVVCLRHRGEAANPGDPMSQKVGSKQIDQAVTKQNLKGSRIGNVAPETQGDYSFISNFVNRLKVGNRTRFIEPKRMHGLDCRCEARCIARGELGTCFKGEIRVWSSGTHRFEPRCSKVNEIAALIARRRIGDRNQESTKANAELLLQFALQFLVG